MKILLSFVAALLVTASALAENLIRNGNFERGSGGWDGDERVEFEDSRNQNHVCRIRLRNESQEFKQEIKSRNLKDITLKFRVKSSPDYSGRGYSIRFTRDNGNSVYYDFNELDKEWSTQAFTFSKIDESKELLLTFEVKSGDSGHIDFDDIVATGFE